MTDRNSPPRSHGTRDCGVASRDGQIPLTIPAVPGPEGQGAGAELDLALIAGSLVVLLSGPGRLALDRMLGVERTPGAAS